MWLNSRIVLVIGIGSALRRDYGVGLVVARRLKAAAPKGIVVATVPPGEPVLPDEWGNHRTVVMVTAMKSGAAPGTVVRLDGLGEFFPAGDFEGSIGMPGPTDIIGKARSVQRLPAEIIVYGIEIEDGGEGPGLSLALTRAGERATAFILRDLGIAGRLTGFVTRHRKAIGAGVAALAVLVAAIAYLCRGRIGPSDDECRLMLSKQLRYWGNVEEFRVPDECAYRGTRGDVVAIRFTCVVRLREGIPDMVRRSQYWQTSSRRRVYVRTKADGTVIDGFSEFIDELSKITGRTREALEMTADLDLKGEGVLEYRLESPKRLVFIALQEAEHWERVLPKAYYRW